MKKINERNTKFPRGRPVKVGDKVYKSLGKAGQDLNMDPKLVSYRINKKLPINGMIGEYVDEAIKETTRVG